MLDEISCPSLQIGGTGDHIHALFSLSRTLTLADVIKHLKTGSSQWMKKQLGCDFSWQAGYGTFSVASSQKEAVIKYIQTQESHHRVVTFQDEFRRLL